MGKYECTWTKPFEIAETKLGGGPDIISIEIQGSTGDCREFYVDTADNGDKGYCETPPPSARASRNLVENKGVEVEHQVRTHDLG